MIDLYAAPTSNGLRAKIMADECGVDYTLHVIDMARGEHKGADYLKINPAGLIPALVDSDGPGGSPVTINQSMAIMIHLADKSGKFMTPEQKTDPVFWQDLMNVATDMGSALMSVLMITRSSEPHAPSIEMFGNRFHDLLKIWDAALAERRFCAGDDVSIVDFAFYPVVLRCKAVTPQFAAGCPNVDRWYDEIGARPGVRKGIDFS
ncbi:MAG: glutathione S-transferase family protein [Rhodospirillaceae bacterium]